MDGLFVEEVAASLVREFLSRKGLKKTCVTMDQEHPRSDLSINSRHDLRKVLHLEFLYRENKAKENPLKTSLELITRYFLDRSDSSSTQETLIPALPIPKKSNRLPLRCSESTLVNIYDLEDEDTRWRTSLSEASKARPDNLDGDMLGNSVSSKRPIHRDNSLSTGPGGCPSLTSVWEKTDRLPSPEPAMDGKRPGEKIRHKAGLIVRGMMAGPMASSPQDSFRKRSLRRFTPSSSKTQLTEKEKLLVSKLSALAPACAGPQGVPASSSASVSRSPSGQQSKPIMERLETTPSRQGQPLQERPRPRGPSEDSSAEDGPEEAPWKLHLSGGNSKTTQELLERTFKQQDSQTPPLRNDRLMPDKVDDELGALRLEDVEDELVREEVILSPGPSVLRLRIASEPIDLALAKEIKTLLFGSAFCCFNEEWKLQSFSFNDTASLKYGIVQNKGGPCGVLAAVQSCVLQKLLFEGESGATCPRYLETPSQSLQQSDKACLPTMMFVPMKRLLQPSDAQRTRCLALAIADILWRAGSHQRAVVTLASGTQQFSPMGKYKADGVLETLMLYSLTCYEDLVTFLQHRVQQFEAGPYGCILLTLSAILSRSPELVRQDFDVPTSHLIGAHGYCTQELVNLLLTGRAVSNVFNDVVELDSGDGRITLLRGIAARSDVGFLSLFEHYNVCQVGCFLKTPRFPIWVVCSESHFSVLFSLQLDLLSDWRAERLFDLYYYDGLANQQEQIRLTVDTTQATPEDSHKDLVPPLELCIRTKWKGASVNWNGSDPIL